jgi:hypothetical protein
MMLWACHRMAELSASKSEIPCSSCTNGLTIDYCRLAAKVDGGTDDRGIAVAPIISVAGEYARLPSLKQHLAAITIVFDFVNPVLALRWLIDRGGKLGLNELEPRSYKGHGTWTL